MAKFDEADPRWIVKEREDGRNVNNWHWTEKDMLDWSKHRLDELFRGKVLLDGVDGCHLTCTGLESLTGEAFVNVRKNKLIPSYELELKVKWTGSVQNGDSKAECSGKLHFPYIADENADEDTELKVLCDTAGAAQDKLKAQLLAKAKKAVIDIIHQFVKELAAGGSERPGASQPPTTSASSQPTTTATATIVNGAKAPATVANGTASASASGSGSGSSSKKAEDTYTLDITEKFYARSQDVFECFTVQGRVCAFTQSQATVEPRLGGKLAWFGGSVQGEFVELEPAKRIVMKWRFSSWEEDCFSRVELSISEPEPGNTVLHLHQTGIPHYDKFGNPDVLNITEKGWRAQVLSRIKAVFGYGI